MDAVFLKGVAHALDVIIVDLHRDSISNRLEI